MINYRIRKETFYDHVTYHPQKGFLGIWWDMCEEWWTGYGSYDAAKKALCNYRQRRKIEYLKVNCDGDGE